MTLEQFELLTNLDESETLDFKKEQYEFNTDDNVAKFIKDIISFTNTIRKTNAYIIIGIEQTVNGKVFHGLNKNLDDSVFQDKVKSKVYPLPKFLYYKHNYNGKDYGIIEIPLNRYPETLSCVVKMKGLEVGKVYIRRGSTNSEALGKEVTQIDKWIQTVEIDIDKRRQVEELIQELNSEHLTLSSCISKALKIANASGNNQFIRFCKGELMGWYYDNVDMTEKTLPSNRMARVMASMYQIHNVSMTKGTNFNLKEELKKDQKFKEINFLIQDSISQIEETIKESNQNGYITINRKLGDISPDAPMPNVPIFIYAQKSTFQDIHQRTKITLTKYLISQLE